MNPPNTKTFYRRIYKSDPEVFVQFGRKSPYLNPFQALRQRFKEAYLGCNAILSYGP